MAALAALALLAFRLVLPGLLASDALRARVGAAARAELGRELGWERLELAGSPTALRMQRPRLAGREPETAPLAEAPSALLHLASGPSLARPLFVDRVDVAGATLRLAPLAPGPALPLELRDLAATLRRAAPDEPVAVDASFRLAGGGRASATGSIAPGGEADLTLTLLEVDAAGLALPLADDSRIAGALAGTLEIAGPLASPSAVSARLELRDGELRVGEVEARGALRLVLDWTAEPAAGSFEIDAGGARLVFARSYHKPPGIPARVSGRLVAGKRGGLGVDDVELHIGEGGAERRP